MKIFKSMKLSATFMLVVLVLASALPLAVGAYVPLTGEVLALSLVGSAGIVFLSAFLIEPAANPNQFRRWNAQAGEIGEVDPEEQYKAVAEQLGKVNEQLKKHAEDAEKALKAHGKISEEAKAAADKLLNEQGALQTRLQTVEQLLAKAEQRATRGDRPQSLGRQFVESEGFKNFASQTSPRGRVDLTVKAAITTLTTDADGSAGDAVNQTRVPGIILPPERRLTVRDLLTPGQMEGNTLEYVKLTGFTNNAAPTAEGVAKPQSTLKLDLVSTTAKVIAHYFKASRQILSDAPQLMSVINGLGFYGLDLVLENQLLNGDGTGQNLLGLIPQATAYNPPIDPAGAETVIDTIRLAFLQATLAELPATGVVMHPNDWARVELLKDTTGRYIIGQPQGMIAPTLWRRPIVETQAIAEDKFLAGAFKMGAQFFERWAARVEVATENEDDFIKNLVTILLEMRGALAVYRPQAFIYGDLGNLT